VPSAGRNSGRCTRYKVSLTVAPSVLAAASVLRDILLKPASTAPSEAARKRMVSASTMAKALPGRISPVGNPKSDRIAATPLSKPGLRN
jgi:hypothetical protein